MTPREGKEQVCDLCGEAPAAVQCIGCSRMLCKKCRSMEIYVHGDGEVMIKNFCAECSKDPAINPPMACEKVFGLEDITEMVNQEDHSKPARFKIRLKMS